MTTIDPRSSRGASRAAAWLIVVALLTIAPSQGAEFTDEVIALPYAPDARNLEFAATFGDVKYVSQSPLKSLAAFYLKEMAKRGWEHDESAAEIEEESIELAFKHDAARVKLQLRQSSKEVRVSLDCEGLKFTGVSDPAKLAEAGLPVSRASLFLQKELPQPAGVQGLQFSGERCNLKSTLSLAEAFDHYSKAVVAKGFRESRKPILNDSRKYTEFKKGNAQVSVNVFSDAVGSRIILEYKDEAKELPRAPLPPVATLPIKGGDKPVAGDPPTAPANLKLIQTASNKGSASVTYAGKQYAFNHVVAFQTKKKGSAPTLAFTAKPLPVNKLQAMLAQKDDVSILDLYEGSVPDRLIVTLGEYSSFNFALSNLTIGNSIDKDDVEMKVVDGRIQATLKKANHEAFKGEQLSFSATADAVIMTAQTRVDGPADKIEKSDQPLLTESPVPFPDKTENVSREGSKFRKTYSAVVGMPLAEASAFYQQELAGKGWTKSETPDGETHQRNSDSLEASLSLKKQGEKTSIQVVTRDVALAKREGILPEAGKGRLLLANAHNVGIVYTIGKTDYPLKAEQGGRDLKQALNYSIAPATYTVVIKVPGQAPQTEQINLTAGSAWAIVVLPTGACLPMQVY